MNLARKVVGYSGESCFNEFALVILKKSLSGFILSGGIAFDL